MRNLTETQQHLVCQDIHTSHARVDIIYCKTTFFAVGRLIRFRGVQCSRSARFFYYIHTIWNFFAGLIFADFQKIAKSAKKSGFTVSLSF